jgi:Ca2+-binding RTX toxin-like protein
VAKLKFDPNMGGNYEFEISGNYQGGEFALEAQSGKSATFVFSANNFTIVFEGERFKSSEGVLTGGKVERITFLDDNGDKLATVTDFSRKASDLTTILVGDGVEPLLAELFEHDDELIGSSAGEYMIGESGDDVILGKGGADRIDGNDGDDVMNGGGGNDEFEFRGNSGKDVIKGFNVGDEENFDLIFIRDVGFSLGKTTENDLKIKFNDGSSVILEGVDFSQRNDVHIDAIL